MFAFAQQLVEQVLHCPSREQGGRGGKGGREGQRPRLSLPSAVVEKRAVPWGEKTVELRETSFSSRLGPLLPLAPLPRRQPDSSRRDVV